MIPIKYKTLIPEISQRSGIDEQTVENVLSFYWRDVRLNLTNLKAARICLLGFGTFIVNRNHLIEKIRRRNRFLSKLQSTPNPNLAIVTEVQDQLAKMNKIKVHQDDEIEKKKNIRTERLNQKNQYEQSTGEPLNSLEKTQPDN